MKALGNAWRCRRLVSGFEARLPPDCLAESKQGSPSSSKEMTMPPTNPDQLRRGYAKTSWHSSSMPDLGNRIDHPVRLHVTHPQDFLIELSGAHEPPLNTNLLGTVHVVPDVVTNHNN